MNIDSIGYNHKHGSDFLIDRPNGIGDWLFLLVRKPAVFKIGNEFIHALSGTFIIYTPETPEYYGAEGDDYIDDWLHFTPLQSEVQLIWDIGIPLNTPVLAHNYKQISSIIRYMMYEKSSGNKFYRKTIDCCFEMLMYKLSEASSGRKNIPKSGLFMDIMDSQASSLDERLTVIRRNIYDFPGREWRAADMAAELSLSESYFQHIYKRVFGISVNQDVMKSRVEKAAELLKNSPELSAKYIGKFVGYRSDSYFSRHFKSVYGVTPSQYRAGRAG